MKLLKIRLAKDRSTQLSRNFAFAIFETEEVSNSDLLDDAHVDHMSFYSMLAMRFIKSTILRTSPLTRNLLVSILRGKTYSEFFGNFLKISLLMLLSILFKL